MHEIGVECNKICFTPQHVACLVDPRLWSLGAPKKQGGEGEEGEKEQGEKEKREKLEGTTDVGEEEEEADGTGPSATKIRRFMFFWAIGFMRADQNARRASRLPSATATLNTTTQNT